MLHKPLHRRMAVLHNFQCRSVLRMAVQLHSTFVGAGLASQTWIYTLFETACLAFRASSIDLSPGLLSLSSEAVGDLTPSSSNLSKWLGFIMSCGVFSSMRFRSCQNSLFLKMATLDTRHLFCSLHASLARRICVILQDNHLFVHVHPSVYLKEASLTVPLLFRDLLGSLCSVEPNTTATQ